MSTNCIRCVVNKRTGFDLLCDDCRNTRYEPTCQEPAPERSYSNLDVTVCPICSAAEGCGCPKPTTQKGGDVKMDFKKGTFQETPLTSPETLPEGSTVESKTPEIAAELCKSCDRFWSPSLIESSTCIFCIANQFKAERDALQAKLVKLEKITIAMAEDIKTMPHHSSCGIFTNVSGEPWACNCRKRNAINGSYAAHTRYLADKRKDGK